MSCSYRDGRAVDRMSNDDLAHPGVPTYVIRRRRYIDIHQSSSQLPAWQSSKNSRGRPSSPRLMGSFKTLSWDDSVEIRREIGFEVARHGGYCRSYNDNALTHRPDGEVMHVFIHSLGHCTCGQELGTIVLYSVCSPYTNNLAHIHYLASRSTSVTGCSGIANMGIRFGWLDSRTCDES